jgi:hypothetical protein
MVQVSYAGLASSAARLLLRALDAREVGTKPPAAGPHLVPAELRIAGSTGSPPRQAALSCARLPAPSPYRPRPRSPE